MLTPLDNSSDTPLESPPLVFPQVTTEPSALRAANAPPVEKISITPLDKSTVSESPPLPVRPQVTTEPSILSAAKALLLEKISVTPLDKSTLLESPP